MAKMTTGNKPEDWQRKALLTEYQACQEDNNANFQGFWTLAAIFIGLSSAFLAGLVYAVISNKDLLNNLFCHNDASKSILIGVIAIIVSVANIIILRKIWGWHKRMKFNSGVNLERMREIDLILGTRKAWRIYAIDRWYEILKEKKWEDKKWEDKKKSEQEKWDALEVKFRDGIGHKYHKKLHKLRADTLELVEQYFIFGKPVNRNGKFEVWSSEKHFPCIINTLMSLWILVIVSAVFLLIYSYICWQWSLGSIGIILFCLMVFKHKLICKKIKCIKAGIKNLAKKIKELYLDL